MISVVQFCIDDAASSGVNCFCRELNRELNAVGGVRSRIVRSMAGLETVEPSGMVLHVHGLWLSPQRQAAAWAREKGVPVVWSTHGMTAPWAMRCKGWKKWPAWWLYQKRNLARAAVLHCTTNLERTWNARLLGCRCPPIVLAPLGTHLPSEPIRQVEDDSRREELSVLFVGRIHPVKGLVSLVRAAALLPSADSLGCSVRFRIVGPDEAGHLAELKALCGDSSLFSFPGEKHGAELAAEYAGCDVLVLPSFTENFGGVVIDALAHGKPVIASRATPWKCLEAERIGWWVDNSPECLAKTIAEVAELPREKLREMGERGRKFVSVNYSWKAVARTMAECYGKLV